MKSHSMDVPLQIPIYFKINVKKQYLGTVIASISALGAYLIFYVERGGGGGALNCSEGAPF